MTADRRKGAATAPSLPFVSIVIPCRNEAQFITHCLDSISENTYPKERLEVLVVDGMSDDGTRDILRRYSELHPFVRLLENERRTTPFAFNIGVTSAKGGLIMIMSAHAAYEAHAIERSVRYSQESGADNVGGTWRIVPRVDGSLARAIAQVMSHPFGVGGARYRTGALKEPLWVDTAAYGCYRRDVFEKVGLFNERLTRGQDMEFNLRLRKAGGRTLLAPGVEIQYFARTDLRHFISHSFRNGRWAILPFCYSEVVPVSPRHLVPFFFACSLIVLTVASLSVPGAWRALAGLAALYSIAAIIAAISIGSRSGQYQAAALSPFVFAGLHLSYGFGSVVGVFQAAFVFLAAPKSS